MHIMTCRGLLWVIACFGIQIYTQNSVDHLEESAQQSTVCNDNTHDGDTRPEKKGILSRYKKQCMAACGCLIGSAALFAWCKPEYMAVTTRLFSSSKKSLTANNNHSAVLSFNKQQQDSVAVLLDPFKNYTLAYYAQNFKMLNTSLVTNFKNSNITGLWGSNDNDWREHFNQPENALAGKNALPFYCVVAVERNDYHHTWATLIKKDTGNGKARGLFYEDQYLLVSNDFVYKHPACSQWRPTYDSFKDVTRTMIAELRRFIGSVNREERKGQDQLSLNNFDYIIISRGYNNEFKLDPREIVRGPDRDDTHEYCDKIYIMATKEAAELYNKLAAAGKKTLLFLCQGLPVQQKI